MAPPVPSVQLTSQHAGPMLIGYIASTTSATANLLAHRSRRFRIRTVSQMANAANVTLKANSMTIMPEFYAGGRIAG